MIKFIKEILNRFSFKRKGVFEIFKILYDMSNKRMVSRKTYDKEVDKILIMLGFDPQEERRLIAEEFLKRNKTI